MELLVCNLAGGIEQFMRWLLPFLVLSQFACDAPNPPVGLFDGVEDVQNESEVGETDTPGDSTGQETNHQYFHPTGIWAFLDVTSDCEFVLSKGFEVLSYSIGVARFEPIDNYEFKEVRTTCVMKETPLLGQESVYSQSLIDALNPSIVYAMVNGFTEGSTYLQAPVLDLWGIKLKDPWHDTMPTSKDDPRIFDLDRDGHPGVTIHVGTMCDVYLVQRSVSYVEGAVVSATHMRANKSSHAEVFRIGATNDLCMTENVDVPKPAYSYLVLKRIDGKDGSVDLDLNGDGEVGCDELIRGLDKIQLGVPKADNSHCRESGGK